MTIEKVYVCDYCGKTFEYEDDCLEHEVEEQARFVKDKIKLYDICGNELPLDTDYGHVDYFWVNDNDAFDYVNKCFELNGFAKPADDTYYTEGYFYYDNTNSCWCNVEELRNQLREIEAFFSIN